jgi:LacI family transcriptional regulator
MLETARDVGHLRVALLHSGDLVRDRTIFRGIIRFARPNRRWLFHTTRPTNWRPELLEGWKPNGIIADLEAEPAVRHAIEMGIPLIGIGESDVEAGFPRVRLDHEAAGRLAGEHLVDRGYRHLAYFGWTQRAECQAQLRGLKAVADGRGCTLAIMDRKAVPFPDALGGWNRGDVFMANWLRSLPKPLGLIIHDDDIGLWLTQACIAGDLRIPEDVGTIGVNDNVVNCEMPYPALTSVQMPYERLGFQAAMMLDRIMRGEELESHEVVLPPTGVTPRDSTTVLAISDPDVVAAVRFIREHAGERISVNDVVAAVPLSRRVLETRFRKLLGRSPLEEIRRAHVERARQLLLSTNAPLWSIAAESGFAHVAHLSKAFREETGQTPGAYRRQLSPGQG